MIHVCRLVEYRVDAGSNTSTIDLQIVRGDEKRNFESERVKYVRESQGTQIRV
jgi:hypothetical protein